MSEAVFSIFSDSEEQIRRSTRKKSRKGRKQGLPPARGGRQAYIRGRRLEQNFAREFRKHGYVCIRSTQSKSPADLVLVTPKKVFFIQVKQNRYYSISPKLTQHYVATLKLPESDAVMFLYLCRHTYKHRYYAYIPHTNTKFEASSIKDLVKVFLRYFGLEVNDDI